MNFPHRSPAVSQQLGRTEIGAILVHAMTRQASSPTARTVILAGAKKPAVGDPIEQRIRYFAGHSHELRSPSGAFFARPTAQMAETSMCESDVYQSGSTNLKTHEVFHPAPVAADALQTLEA